MSVISFTAQAQYNSLTINNNANCEVYVQLSGADNPSCNYDYWQDNAFSIPANSSVSFTDPDDVSIQGYDPLEDINNMPLTSSDYFTRVQVYSSTPDPGTMCSVIHVYDMTDCAPANTTQATTIEDGFNACSSCGSGNIVWTTSGTTITIDIL